MSYSKLWRNFMIPWDKFPEELIQSLERGQRPSPRMRREMVRILVREMMQKGPCISRRKCTEVAQKVVAKYPQSLQDVIDGDVIGPVKCLMRKTFYKQRKEVNQGKSIKYLQDEWPFLFTELGMEVHFKELTGIRLKETFTQNVDMKGKRLLSYMNTFCVNKSKFFLQALTKLKVMRGELSGCSEELKEMLLLLLSYFDEKEDGMFYYVEDTCLAEEVQMDQVHLTPMIVVCGRYSFSSRRFMLSLDRRIVHNNIPSFGSSLCMMFGSYYCFNIHYPSKLASTLEFL
ncbi:uncharacterized protein LOC114841933 [Betta splendens]|uniref:Uncharacterized protein LOC114841933 n=1 Tax=Betta splendens TaxID=158456 RepID=A0A9W2XAI6_BETSP|nr:uncharacterized protein LOC114841933 [Betta splendens]